VNWREALEAVAAELHRRGENVASKNNAMVSCGAVKAEVADAQAQIYRWIEEDLKLLTTDSGRESLVKLRRWKAGR
jgi:hypothetical protein